MVFRDFADGSELFRQGWTGIAAKMGDHGGIVRAEIVSKPDIDAGDEELSALDANPPRMVDVVARRAFQYPVHGGPAIGLSPQIGTADRGAIDRVVDTRIPPDRA